MISLKSSGTLHWSFRQWLYILWYYILCFEEAQIWLKMDSKVLKNFHILRVQEIRDKSAKVEKSYGISLYIT